MSYEDLNDYELISYINKSDEESKNILLKKYEPLINNMANKIIRTCPYLGIEVSDLVQEGFIGLNHAMGYFNEQKNITFYTFAKTCIERKMISVIISAKRLKHKNLNESISFDTEDDGMLDYLLKDETLNPEKIVIDKKETDDLINLINENLTELERDVFRLMLSDFNYKEIANILEKEPKQIDNAIQRIKSKSKEIIKKYNEK